MNQIEAENFVKQLFHDIWEGHDISRFNDYYHADIQADAGGKPIDFATIQLHAQTMKTEWSNTQVVFKDIISNGHNKIAVRFVMSSIKQGQAMSFEMMGIYDLKDNKLFKIFGLSNPPMTYPDSNKPNEAHFDRSQLTLVNDA